MAGIGDEQVEKGTEMSPNVACEGHVIYFLSLGLASYSWYPQFPLHLPRIFTQVSPSEDACDDQFSSVTQSCLTLCDSMDCSMPGFPVHHQLLELTQTHVH